MLMKLLFCRRSAVIPYQWDWKGEELQVSSKLLNWSSTALEQWRHLCYDRQINRTRDPPKFCLKALILYLSNSMSLTNHPIYNLGNRYYIYHLHRPVNSINKMRRFQQAMVQSSFHNTAWCKRIWSTGHLTIGDCHPSSRVRHWTEPTTLRKRSVTLFLCWVNDLCLQ